MANISKFPLVALYFGVSLWLTAGAAAYGANSAVILVICHGVAFVVLSGILARLKLFEFVLDRFAGNVFPRVRPLSARFWRLVVVLLGIFCLIVWSSIGGVPLLETLVTKDSLEAVRIRGLISDRGSPVLNYAVAIMLSGVMPVVCLFAILLNAPCRNIVLLLSIVFASSLLQKSYPLMVVFPCVVYLLLSRKYSAGLKVFLVGVFGAVIVHFALVGYLRISPSTISFKQEIAENTSGAVNVNDFPGVTGSSNTKALIYQNLSNLADRVFLIPGRTGAIWMDFIPSELPFLHGCGYRLVAKLLGCSFRNYAEEIHALYEPGLHDLGIKGTMNVAEVFNCYANFGMFGGVLSGIVMALIIYFITSLFSRQPRIGIAVSTAPVLMSSSSALLTLLLSGGWAIAVLISLYFCRWMPVGPEMFAGSDSSNAGIGE